MVNSPDGAMAEVVQMSYADRVQVLIDEAHNLIEGEVTPEDYGRMRRDVIDLVRGWHRNGKLTERDIVPIQQVARVQGLGEISKEELTRA